MRIVILAAEFILAGSIGILSLYAIRHYLLSIARVSLPNPLDMGALVGYQMPRISVMVPMHNEGAVASDILQALVDCDYDWNKLEILAINDRSDDDTGEIIDAFAARYPMIKALHRSRGNGGKPGALQFASSEATGEFLLMFDADYVPGPATLMQLVAPFADPQVGAVMGRVVPHNFGDSILAGLLSLERAAGYQVAQQARYQLGLCPQFGGTVGGVRVSALRAVGGWNTESLTEDTDLTCRLILNGWRIAYVNRAECYEEVPHTWMVRRKQLTRWVTGHTECLHRYGWDVVLNRQLTVPEKVDTLFMLACYLTAPVMLLAWMASLIVFFSGHAGALTALVIGIYFTGYQLFANQATFFEIGTAALLDGGSGRILLLPMNVVNFFASTGATCSALIRFYARSLSGLGTGPWHKTARSRGTNGNGKGLRNGTNGNGSSPRNGTHTNSLLARAPNGLYGYNPEGSET